MDPQWVLFIFLFAAAALFFGLEVLVPSAGILGTLATASLIGAIVALFLIDLVYGWIGIGVAMVLVPVCGYLALKMLPHTPIGRHMILQPPPELSQPVRYTSTGEDNYDDLLNATGKVISTLRPVGMVQFGDRKVECLAERGPVDPGTTVKVISVRGFEVKVRTV